MPLPCGDKQSLSGRHDGNVFIEYLQEKGYLPTGAPDATPDAPSPAKPAGKPKR